MNTDQKVSLNIKENIKKKYGTGTNCAKGMNVSSRYLNDTVNKIGKGIFPSMKFIKKIAKMCDCDYADFFK